MCGIAGFYGLNVGHDVRLALVSALGDLIDTRGGHAIGYADHTGCVGKRAGMWRTASSNFRSGAARGTTCIMHARFATCGKHDDPRQAHPFTVYGSEGAYIGVHNGVLHGTQETARERGRSHTVDSLEFYRLLADGEYDAIASLRGYGALVYRNVYSPDVVYLVRMTQGSDLHIASVASGGYVWASTESIALRAMADAGLECDGSFLVEADGRPTAITPDGVFHMSGDRPIKLANEPAMRRDASYYDSFDWATWPNWER